MRVRCPPRELSTRRRKGGQRSKRVRSRTRWRTRSSARARAQSLLRMLLMYSVAKTHIVDTHTTAVLFACIHAVYALVATAGSLLLARSRGKGIIKRVELVEQISNPPPPSTPAAITDQPDELDRTQHVLRAHQYRSGWMREWAGFAHAPHAHTVVVTERDPAEETAWVRDLTADGDVEPHPGPEGARPISALAWNVNGIHVHSRKGIGDTSDEGLGDGSDLLAEPQARMRTVVDLIVQEKTSIAVLTETHMRAAELTAAVGYLPRVHGLEAFGTAGGYSGRKGARASGGVLVVWDPSVLISEGTEVVKAHRIVRVSLRVKADGASLHLVGAYMPVRRQTSRRGRRSAGKTGSALETTAAGRRRSTAATRS